MRMKAFALVAALAALFPVRSFALNANGRVTIAVIGKSESNPVFRLTHAGAVQAGKDLSAQLHLNVQVLWETPKVEDAQAQADQIHRLVLQGVDGIAVACSDRRRLTEAIDAAVDAGIPVATFNSDAEGSKRCYYFGADNHAAGVTMMGELGKAMGGKGVIAILAGNPHAPNLQQRAQGVRDAAAKFPDVVVRGTYYCEEKPEAAAARIAEIMAANPDIAGWALVGGYSLYAPNAYHWKPGQVKVVAVASMPQQLDYVRQGYVQAIVVQASYDWGYRSVDQLVRKIAQHRDPDPAMEIAASAVVTPENVDAYARRVASQLAQGVAFVP